MNIETLRRGYHKRVCARIVSRAGGGPNFADTSSAASVGIANKLLALLNAQVARQAVPAQTAGQLFEDETREFIKDAFALLTHLRPGRWEFSVGGPISQFEQYEHLARLSELLKRNPELKAALGGDYLVTPDIIVARHPVPDRDINRKEQVVKEEKPMPVFTPLRARNRTAGTLILHASISCKWTIRSDRAQNIRTEGLNLIRNRKGHTPHIVAVTAEPLPTRLASLALGTGDLDCIYHFALHELIPAVEHYRSAAQSESLKNMIDGGRLRDISDLPFDLAV